MQRTTNYSLPQWEASDRVTRGDVNAAMSAVDTALAAKCSIVAGTYYGSGNDQTQTVSLGFTPKAVIMTASQIGNQQNLCGLVLPNSPITYSGNAVMEIVNGGFRVTGGANIACTHNYVAFR